MTFFTPELDSMLKAKVYYTSAQVTVFAKKYKKAKTSATREYYKQKVIEGTVKLAFKYCSSTMKNDRENLGDHFQLAMLGILEALERFNPNTKFKFSTYAVFWIRYYTNIFFHESTIVKHPRDSYIGAAKYEKIISESMSSDKTIEAILREKKITKDQFTQWERAFYTKSASSAVTRIDKAIYDDSGSFTSIKDIMPSTDVLHDITIEKNQIIDIIKDFSRFNLDKQEQAILEHRFYPEDGVQKDYLWISEKMKISPKSIKKIEAQLVNKIKIIMKRNRRYEYSK